ncbi:hypothetical protein CGCF415_v007192 [Colletotrichum fructicola]|nr:hypothetical protein CGCFRS4_v004460 [Colletotrichum fructicola]KAF4907686.1 hypothetical protein CGCF415_v007192 [Colletotrichum fructicola]
MDRRYNAESLHHPVDSIAVRCYMWADTDEGRRQSESEHYHHHDDRCDISNNQNTDIGEADSYKNSVHQQRTVHQGVTGRRGRASDSNCHTPNTGPLIGVESDIRSSASEAELVVLGRDDACNEGSMALAGIDGVNVKLSEKTMKTMRSLLAKLQGITPDPSPTIRFRRDLVPHSPPSIPTGYDTAWQTRRLENYSSNPLLRLPNELLLEIM